MRQRNLLVATTLLFAVSCLGNVVKAQENNKEKFCTRYPNNDRCEDSKKINNEFTDKNCVAPIKIDIDSSGSYSITLDLGLKTLSEKCFSDIAWLYRSQESESWEYAGNSKSVELNLSAPATSYSGKLYYIKAVLLDSKENILNTSNSSIVVTKASNNQNDYTQCNNSWNNDWDNWNEYFNNWMTQQNNYWNNWMGDDWNEYFNNLTEKQNNYWNNWTGDDWNEYLNNLTEKQNNYWENWAEKQNEYWKNWTEKQNNYWENWAEKQNEYWKNWTEKQNEYWKNW